MSDLPWIDWDAAGRAASKVVAPGPEVRPDEAADAVAELRRAAVVAAGHVAETTGLATPAEGPNLVVDRSTWVEANLRTLRGVWGEIEAPSAPHNVADRARGAVLGAEMALVFAAVSSRILGQFDPFGSPHRLLLVAPNVVGVERHLGLRPDDFRLWVCLHEQTHRFQFGAAPWLRGYLIAQLRTVLGDLGSSLSLGPSKDADGRSLPLVQRVLNAEQRQAFDRATAAMSLLEGHADVMMDRVGTAVLPSLPALRSALEGRRNDVWQQLIGKLLGMDLKMAQYREGAAFVRVALDAVGLDAFNRVFESAETLPTRAEIAAPELWVDRVCR